MKPHLKAMPRLGLALGLCLLICLAGAPAARAAVTFAAQTKVGVGLTPVAVALGDLNGDGNLDLVVVNRGESPGTVSVRLGDGAGGFGTETKVSVGLVPVAVALGDLNGDGNLDLVVVNSGESPGTVSVRLGNGLGGFGTESKVSVGLVPGVISLGPPLSSSAGAIALGDLNGDGNLDLVVVNSGESPGTVSVRLGNGLGGFGTESKVSVGLVPVAVALGDLDGDGNLDLVVVNSGDSILPSGAGTVSVRLGNGLGGFGTESKVSVGLVPVAVALGDLNGGGRPDAVTANQDSGNVSVMLETGAGSLGAATNFSVDLFNPYAVALGDLDGDGKLDIAVVKRAENTVGVLLGNGTGAFGSVTDFSTGLTPVAVALGDLGGDGKLDLVVVNNGDSPGTVSVLLNTTTVTPPTPPPPPPGDGGDCFIATAAYGSTLAPQVELLREFRDRYLLPHRGGQAFVALYYRLGPGMAQAIARSEAARAAVRVALTPMIWWAGLMLASPVAGASVSLLALGLAAWLGLVLTHTLRRSLRR